MVSVDRVGSPAAGARSFRLWQVPTAVFDVAVVAVLIHLRPSGWSLVEPVVALVLVLGASLAAALVPWSRIHPGWVMVIPVVDLVAAAMINVYGHQFLATAVLTCALPAGWLAFVFDGRGMAASLIGTLAVVVAPLVIDGDVPSTTAAWAELLNPPVVIIGICVVTYLLSRILARTQDRLLRSAEDVAVRTMTIDGILGAVDVAVSVHRGGQPPLRNDPARRLVERAGSSAGGEPSPGDHLYGPDQVTRLSPDEHVLARALRGESFAGVLCWVGPPGDQVAGIFSSRPLHDDAGDRVGAVLAAWDATDLLGAIAAREAFLANVSHELRTPLTSIVGNLELLGDELDRIDGDTTRADRMRAVMTRNSAVLLTRIEQVLGADDERLVQAEVVDVAVLTRTALTKHRVLADAAGLELQVDGPQTLSASVDPIAFEQVLDNLVSNAIKYTEVGVVAVTLSRRDGGFTLGVTDTGIGMRDAEARAAFDRYFRGDTAMALAIPGIGLGLAITRRLVELHGGTIELSSTPGRGTTVTVGFPG